jgi:hypothetical protein
VDLSVQGLAGEILSLSLGPGASFKRLKESIALALGMEELVRPLGFSVDSAVSLDLLTIPSGIA